MPTINHNEVNELLNFWFAQENKAKWFVVDINFDQEISSRFNDLYKKIKDGFDYSIDKSPEEILSAIIALDQLPRNMFRNLSSAFATDDKALIITKNAIKDGIDLKLSDEQRHFLYMPLMHSENLADQELSVELFSHNKQAYEYAKSHLDIIKNFGRFPYRNNTLGRVSTEEELSFLSNK